MSSYQQKQLRVTFVLTSGNNTFPGTGSNTLILTGLRTVALVKSVVGFATQLDLQIYGMKQADMNALSVILFKPNPTAVQTNVVTLEANSGSGWTQIFTGTITECSPEYRTIPEAYLHLQAQIGYAQGVQVTPALSYPNGALVSEAVQAVATAMGFHFQNNGVTAQLPAGSYFPGAPWAQLQAITQNSGTDLYMDANQTIVICPQGQPRQNASTIALSPTSGLIGYPSIDVFGIVLTALFNPEFILAGQIQVQGTEVPAANGLWSPFSMQHQLESLKFGGVWQSTMQCAPVQI